MSTLSQKPIWFGDEGESIPSSPTPDSRGQLALVNPSSADDVPHICLTRSDGTVEYLELALVEDLIDAYTKAEVDALLADYYTEAEVDTILGDYYTSAEVDLELSAYLLGPPYRATYKTQGRGIFGQVVAAGNSTTFISTGQSHTLSSFAQSNQDNSKRAQIRFNTTTASPNTASLICGAPGNAIQSRWDPWFEAVVAPSTTITDVRVWVGFFASTPGSSDDPAINHFGFRFSTSASDATYKCVSNDGSGGGAITDSFVTVAGATDVRLAAAVNSSGTEIEFWVNDILVAVHTTNLPSTSAYLGGGVYVTNLTGSQRAIQVSSFAWGY